ncbi:MAG: polyprenyl synthetase family protein [Candidatus Altiarchaeales archaeon]|nr:polyprenyl synthetase family protein [Candidatus Altiarchaeales archaeon]
MKKVLADRKKKIDPVLMQYSKSEERLAEMVSHPITSGGKRLRPALVLLSAEALGAGEDDLLPAAASVELLHTFTLVHDDIMDHDLQRRGTPTVHSIWGLELGILVGDVLYSSAFNALLDMQKSQPKETVLKAIGVLVDANTKLQQGQLLDMLFEKQEKVELNEYLRMIKWKTAVLMSASTQIGAIFAGADEKQYNALGDYGENLGMAFQIKDDLLDLTGDEKQLGKPVGSDVRKGKRTLMVVHALENTEERQLRLMREVLGNREASTKQMQEFIETLEGIGSIEYAENKLKHYVESTRNALEDLSESPAKDALEGLLDFSIKRSS